MKALTIWADGRWAGGARLRGAGRVGDAAAWFVPASAVAAIESAADAGRSTVIVAGVVYTWTVAESDDP